MGIVTLFKNSGVSKAKDSDMLFVILKRMYEKILVKHPPDTQNLEGVIEAELIRAIYSTLSLLRYEMKYNKKIIED